MFDPLVRTSSTNSRTGSLLRSGSTSSQSAFAFLKQSGKGEELTASGDMFGVQPTAAMQQQQQQQPMSMATQMMQQPMMMGTNMISSYVSSFLFGVLKTTLIIEYVLFICVLEHAAFQHLPAATATPTHLHCISAATPTIFHSQHAGHRFPGV